MAIKIPSWFNSAEYLKTHLDVAADKWYGERPFLHFMSTGYPERRTWRGDPRSSVVIPPKPEPEPPKPKPKPNPGSTMSKKVVAEIKGQSFMSMTRLSNGRILAGTYSFPGAISHLYQIGKSEPIASINVGESIFRITEDGENLFLACEYEKVFHSLMSHINFQPYLDLKAGRHRGAFDVKRLIGKLVSVGGGEIKTDGHTTKKWSREYYVKFAFQVLNTAFVAGYSFRDRCAGWFDSGDARTWKWKNIGPRYSRFMQAAISNDQKTIWLVGTVNYKNGHNRDSAALWKYDVPTGQLQRLHKFGGFDYISCVEIGPDGQVYFILTRGWRSQRSGATLVRWDGGQPHAVTEFDEAEGRAIVFDGSKILCALRKDKEGGQIYEISGVI